MKNGMNFLSVVAVVVALLPLGYVWSIYDVLPDRVPTHFGLDGPDAFGGKGNIWLIPSVLALASIIQFFMLTNMKRFDTKHADKYDVGLFLKLAFGLVVFLSGIGFFVVYSISQGSLDSSVLIGGLGFLFVFLGNLLYSIKPNYFVGIRLPWTLKDADNWRKTHQIGGRMMFGGGILLVLAAFFLNMPFLFYAFIAVVFLVVAVPVGYSYLNRG
jgi:uncharacterized membrane protein